MSQFLPFPLSNCSLPATMLHKVQIRGAALSSGNINAALDGHIVTLPHSANILLPVVITLETEGLFISCVHVHHLITYTCQLGHLWESARAWTSTFLLITSSTLLVNEYGSWVFGRAIHKRSIGMSFLLPSYNVLWPEVHMCLFHSTVGLTCYGKLVHASMAASTRQI